MKYAFAILLSFSAAVHGLVSLIICLNGRMIRTAIIIKRDLLLYEARSSFDIISKLPKTYFKRRKPLAHVRTMLRIH